MTKHQTASPSVIALTETNDSYLMKVDLPLLPTNFGIGGIRAGKNNLIVETGGSSHFPSPLSQLLSIQTRDGKMQAVYQQGALYILLAKNK